MASSQHTVCKSLRIHENEIQHEHAKLSPIKEHQFEFTNPEKETCQNDGAEQAARRPSDINSG